MAVVVQRDLVGLAGTAEIFLQVGQRNHLAQRGRINRAFHHADFFGFYFDGGIHGGRSVSIENDSHKRERRGAVGFDAGDHFLTDVTALVVTDGSVFQSRFGKDVGFVHVPAVNGKAGFDSQGFPGFGADGTRPTDSPAWCRAWSRSSLRSAEHARI